MSRVSLVLIFLLCSVSLSPHVPSAEAQLAPEITLTCEDTTTMTVAPGSQKIAYISCVVENPTVHTITVQITVQGGILITIAPPDFTINQNGVWEFIVTYGGNTDTRSGPHESTITAVITKVNSVTYPADNPRSYSVLVNVEQYVECQYDLKQQQLAVGAGSELIISSRIDCQSNDEFTRDFQILIVDRETSSTSLPSGFEYKERICTLESNSTGVIASENCRFVIKTPVYLLKTWNSCVIIIEIGDENTDLCHESLSMEIKVKTRIWWAIPLIMVVSICIWAFQGRLQELLTPDKGKED